MVEPPTAVSAKLVRLAADARPSPGLWARFVDAMGAFGRSPALAAAAMAVVVAGGAGFIYMRSGGKGVFGPIPMPPNPPEKISDADLKEGVGWILKQ